ncbi:MAG: cellulase family glycosylhydrolase [Thermoleophilaceae bacterium]|nr:cellulase family glycosylhydrolase [Thermoleophilaceae bacterium]
MRTFLTALVCAAALGVIAAPAVAAPAAVRPLPLHADPDKRSGGRIVDSRGREVLLRGVNVNALADYWKGTRFPTVFPLARRDPARMAAIGWNAVRLLVSWSRVEPEPGRYDGAYLGEVAATVRMLARQGIYTIVDLHQDAWGPSLAAPAGESCRPQELPALGWDGAPAWATLDGGRPRCYPQGTRELSPAVRAAWTAFFTNAEGPGGVGIQTRYLRMLRRVARRFARSAAVAGFDLMNEPNAIGATEQQALSDFYGRALAQVRAGERAGKGRRHLVLFEPSVLWSAVGSGPPPDFKRDRDVVYAPHIYSGGFTNGPIARSAFAVAREEARGFGGAPVLTGEWGTDPGRAGDPEDRYFLRHQAFQDSFRFGATLWTWRESCGDPHKVGELRAGRVPRVWGAFQVNCANNRVTRVRRALVSQLTRGYVRAAPGRLTRTRYSLRGTLTAEGRARRRHGRLVAFLPLGRPTFSGVSDQYLPANCLSVRMCLSIRTSGLRDVHLVRGPGQSRYVVAAPAGGRWTLKVGTRR